MRYTVHVSRLSINYPGSVNHATHFSTFNEKSVENIHRNQPSLWMAFRKRRGFATLTFVH